MKRYLIILTLYLCAVVPTMAQYYSVNYDKRTVEAMTAAFATEAATEAYYAEQVAKIREHYQAAEVAAAGIFTSKFLDRKALTHLGLWTSSTENYYYRRIYNMVSAKIMPKIWTVAGMMLKNPQNALYWGSYLYKVCEETKTLCYQFESIVTNSTLSFKDIAFLEINQELAAILKLSELGYNNEEYQAALRTVITDVINQHLKLETVSMMDIMADIKAKTDDDLIGCELTLTVDGVELDTVSAGDESVRFSLNRLLYLRDDGKLGVKEDITFTPKMHITKSDSLYSTSINKLTQV